MPKYNPHLMKPDHVRINDKTRGEHYYIPSLKMARGGFVTHARARTATLALEKAKAIHDRWCRLYDKAIEMEAK